VDLSQLVAQHGLSIVFANVLLTQLGVPVPAMPILIIAGALLADGTLSPLSLMLVVVAASLIGDTPWYYAGRKYGYKILRTVCRISIEPDSCVKQTENIFTRFGSSSLLVAKYIPGFSTVAPPLAGTMKLPLSTFLAYSTGGALLWAALPIAGGAFFRREVEWVLQRLGDMGAGAVGAVGALVLAYIAVKAIERYLLIRFLRMVRISAHELRAMLGEVNPPVVLDVRSSLAREAEPRRIPGAISVSLDSVGDLAAGVPPDRDVVVYCS
jgi:membrane protein DedA with SNARE-associated domain